MAATWLAMDLSRTGYLMWSPALRHDVNNSEYAEVRDKLQGALRTVSPHVKRIILPGQPPVFGMPHRIAAGPPVRGHAPPPPGVCLTPRHRKQGNCHSKLLRITTRLPMPTRADCFCSSGKWPCPGLDATLPVLVLRLINGCAQFCENSPEQGASLKPVLRTVASSGGNHVVYANNILINREILVCGDSSQSFLWPVTQWVNHVFISKFGWL